MSECPVPRLLMLNDDKHMNKRCNCVFGFLSFLCLFFCISTSVPPPPSLSLSLPLALSLCSRVDQAIPVLAQVKVFIPVPSILHTTRYVVKLYRLHKTKVSFCFCWYFQLLATLLPTNARFYICDFGFQ